MASPRVISSDSHVFEPPDLWASRVEPKFRDQAPHMVRMDDGSDWWCLGDQKVLALGVGSQVGRRFEEEEKLTLRDVFENVRPGGYIPGEHVKDMDLDGVDVNILYPTVGLVLRRVSDTDLLTALMKTFNDWLAEFCQPFPSRLKGIAMLNIDDVRGGVKELERCAKMGLVGAMIPAYPPAARQYDSSEYEPLWAAAEDLGIPLSLHLGTNRLGPSEQSGPEPPASYANDDRFVRMSLGNMIYSGVFERHPGLQVGAVEYELAWIPHFINRMDYVYTQRAPQDNWHKFKDDALPSDYFHRNVFTSFQEDALGIQLRGLIGVDILLWGSDYPHTASTFPRSQQILNEILSECTQEEKAKIVGGNTARIYHLD